MKPRLVHLVVIGDFPIIAFSSLKKAKEHIKKKEASLELLLSYLSHASISIRTLTLH